MRWASRAARGKCLPRVVVRKTPDAFSCSPRGQDSAEHIILDSSEAVPFFVFYSPSGKKASNTESFSIGFSGAPPSVPDIRIRWPIVSVLN